MTTRRSAWLSAAAPWLCIAGVLATFATIVYASEGCRSRNNEAWRIRRSQPGYQERLDATVRAIAGQHEWTPTSEIVNIAEQLMLEQDQRTGGTPNGQP